MITSYQILTGTNEAADGDVDKEVIAAQTGQTLYILRGVVSVTVAAAGNGGLVALENGAGGARFFEAYADAVGSYKVDFGEEGYPLSSETALNLTVDGDGVTEATARATIVAKVV